MISGGVVSLPFPVAVLGEHEVPLALSEEPEWALLSIRAPGRGPLGLRILGPRLDLEFDDIDHVLQGVWSAEYTLPSRVHVRAITDFAHRLEASPPRGLIVHCAAGISRSTASVIGLGAILLDDSMASLLLLAESLKCARDRDWRDDVAAHPNRRLVALFDHELGRNGELVRGVLRTYWPSLLQGCDIDLLVREVLSDALNE